MHMCTHILYPTLLFVAQSKNTHSTDNKNVKPLKANVPKVLHDNFEQPRKIRPQVTDYLKNELPICAVLENQDILQDKTSKFVDCI